MRNSLSLTLVPYLVLLAMSVSLAQSPGDTVGYAGIVALNDANAGNLIAADSLGGFHFTWTNTQNYPPIRQVYYNFIDQDMNWAWPGIGTQVSYRNNDGFPQITVLSGNRSAVIYHNAVLGDSIFLAIDAYRGAGAFEFRHLSFLADSQRLLWPHFCIDRRGNIQMIATGVQSEPGWMQPIGYCRSTDEGLSWTTPELVDRVYKVSALIVSSPFSYKVAIVYAGIFSAQSEIYSDIYYLQSTDGITWDFLYGRINVTNYGTNSDSLRAYGGVDAAYDFNDELNIIWNAKSISNNVYDRTTHLYHFSQFTGTITEMNQITVPANYYCDRQNILPAISQPSLGAQYFSSNLYAVYVGNNPYDCSRDSIPNGELFMQNSSDWGATWTEPLNLTNSPSPGCVSGNCMSDLAPSVVKKVDDYLRIFYTLDTGDDQSPMLYFPFYVIPISTGSNDARPTDFSLSQNYPNPFNARTNISFNLEKAGDIRLTVYDITGALTTTLVDDRLESGLHSVNWDSDGSASGIYYYCLRTAAGSRTKKMILIK